jgi:hypothetical protein
MIAVSTSSTELPCKRAQLGGARNKNENVLPVVEDGSGGRRSRSSARVAGWGGCDGARQGESGLAWRVGMGDARVQGSMAGGAT